MLSTPPATTSFWRPAEAVQAHAGDLDRPAGREHGVAGNIRALLAGLRHTAGDHVVNLGQVEAGALGQAVQGLGQKLLGMDAGQGALARLAATSRRADGVQDVGVGHDDLLSGTNDRAISG
jgi:hypothetical protein